MSGGDHFRSHARTPVAVAAHVRRAATGRRLAARIVDIGIGGAGLVLDEPLVVGESVVLEVAPPSRWDPVPLLAVVAWTSRGPEGVRAGLAFDHRDADGVRAVIEIAGA